ncbi:GumC family protein [Tritonibacter multivorans]|uniref:GumC family protein n=1 Tax=Tritonibacter multivorans TaxID=928856 RepID=UPI00071DEBE8|nr:Wzz/FepE/Etk N-terminal domain-containing protein [Tritonibacter multivorans]
MGSTTGYAPSSSGARDSVDYIDIHRVLRGLRRRIWLLIFVAIAAAGAFAGIASLQEPQYESSATLMLDPREQRALGNQTQVVQHLKLTSPIVDSEVAVLRGQSLQMRALELVLGDPELARRYYAIDPALQPPGLVDRLQSIASSALSQLFGSAATAGPEPIAEPRDESADLDGRKKRILGVLRKGLSVHRIGESYAINLRQETADPELSATFANALAAVYIQEQVENRRKTMEEVTGWLQVQVDASGRELERAEEAVRDFRVADSWNSKDVLRQQLDEMKVQIAETRADQVTKRAWLQTVASLADENEIMVIAQQQGSSLLQQLHNELEALLREDVRLSSSLSADHPDRRNLAVEMARLRANIDDAVLSYSAGLQSEVEVLHLREKDLEVEIAAMDHKLEQLELTDISFRQLERKADAARISYENLLARLGEARAQVTFERAEAKVIDPAEISLVPSSPKVKLMAAFGAALGLSATLIFIVLREFVSAGFTQANELENHFALPVLGSIPHVRMKKPFAVIAKMNMDRFSPLAERVRQISAILGQKNKSGDTLTMVVMSSLPDEGKTTTAMAMAYTYASFDKRTVLVDLDTRCAEAMPALTQGTGPDLSSWLEKGGDPSACTYPSQQGDFWVIGNRNGAGNMVPPPSRDEIRALLTELSKNFDVIVVDAPPLLVLSDGLAIAKEVDHILMNVRYRKTAKQSVATALALLEKVGERPTGLIMTMTDAKSEPQAYGYGYSYGYS